MRKSRFTEAQIIGMIKEQEAGMPTAEVCRRHGLSMATFYKLANVDRLVEARLVRDRSCLAAIPHATNLSLAGFGATNRMTGPSVIRGWA